MDGSCRALEEALTASLALLIIDIGHIVNDSDSVELADLGAFAATYTSGLAGLACNSALVLVDAGHIDPAGVLWSGAGITKLDNVLWTSLYTSAACGALGSVDHRKARFRVHGDRAELACLGTVSATQAAECATGVTAVESGFHLA